ncbi:hypothetical protein FCM35_KLT14564 [Carex littledalei]|uniref:DUF4378 domain-containing protein n=1 Tax=Carex littledalei TaxID=544730 RepID=A0A833UZU9_9POAL|nr:hypothetical protein FCM35_KLT14564 [Carex littledalei]
MVPDKPLMLKDYLALDTESSNVGFQCYPRMANTGPTVRHLLDVELGGSGTLVRSRSRNTLNKISSAIKFRFFQKQESFLSRNLSRKLKGSFWRRRWQQEKEDMELERRSFDYPSPVVSSFRSWLEMGNASDFVSGSGSGSESPLPSRKEIREDKKIEEKEYPNPNPMEQCLDVEKEQLSPVSVMDFPFDEEEEEEEEEEEDDVTVTTSSSPPFHRSTANHIERTDLHIVQKSRRFDNIDEIKPVDLEEEFSAVESRCYSTLYNMDETEIAWDLLVQLGSVENFEKLLLDFFTEGLSSNVQQMKLLNEARDWVNNEGWRWESRGCRGQLELREMEKNGKWRCFEREQLEVCINLESIILEALVQELVDDIIVEC